MEIVDNTAKDPLLGMNVEDIALGLEESEQGRTVPLSRLLVALHKGF